jgi:PAS domain-containing protein
MPFTWSIAIVLIVSSVCAAFVALFALSALQSRKQARAVQVFGSITDEMVFLFDQDVLIDASDSANDFLAAASTSASPWGKLCALLEPNFPGFEARIAKLADARRLVLSGLGKEGLTLIAEWRFGLSRITLSAKDPQGKAVSVDRLSYQAMDHELAGLRSMLDVAPVLIWRQDGQAGVSWANRAYLELAADRDGEDHAGTWPLPRLFDVDGPQNQPIRRAKLAIPGEKKPRWFDIHRFEEGEGVLQFALAADATVHAELALREFIQTLTKTFAHLPIGLAIFDRQRQLALFNPALIDLTGLGPDFLSARPTLFTFLDRLREDNRMPEPKNYKLWRQQMVALERAASSGQYEEIWSLPGGQTYRVTGRPHPDGAMALLIEDISAEMQLTRRFRAELELGQAVIDSLPEAVAVFSPAGVLVLSNSAYARLWGADPSTSLTSLGVNDALAQWAGATQPSPIWARLRDRMESLVNRSEWRDDALMPDGRRLQCRMQPIQGGSTLIGFTTLSPEPALAQSRRATTAKKMRSRPEVANRSTLTEGREAV